MKAYWCILVPGYLGFHTQLEYTAVVRKMSLGTTSLTLIVPETMTVPFAPRPRFLMKDSNVPANRMVCLSAVMRLGRCVQRQASAIPGADGEMWK